MNKQVEYFKKTIIDTIYKFESKTGLEVKNIAVIKENKITGVASDNNRHEYALDISLKLKDN